MIPEVINNHPEHLKVPSFTSIAVLDLILIEALSLFSTKPHQHLQHQKKVVQSLQDFASFQLGTQATSLMTAELVFISRVTAVLISWRYWDSEDNRIVYVSYCSYLFGNTVSRQPVTQFNGFCLMTSKKIEILVLLYMLQNCNVKRLD